MAEAGQAERQDDPAIADDEILWRRVLPEWIHTEANGNTRPQSISFVDRRSGELSVHRARLTTAERVLNGWPGNRIAAFPASLPRSLGYKLICDATDDDASHALVCPSPEGKNAKR